MQASRLMSTAPLLFVLVSCGSNPNATADSGTTTGATSGGPGATRPGPCSTTLTGTTVDLSNKTLPSPLPGIPTEATFSFAEGPVWANGALYFSYLIQKNESPLDGGHLMKYTQQDGISIFLEDAATNGLALDSSGNLIVASHGIAGLATVNLGSASTTLSPLTTEYAGHPFNSPNDLAVRSDGTIYFTDPNYQCGGCNNQPIMGTYRRSPNGTVELLENVQHDVPNGIALSPDEQTLYVGGSQLRAYPVSDDGSVGVGRDFGAVNGTDGLGMDCAGNLYVTLNGQNRIIALDPAGNQLPGALSLQNPTNVAFGGADGKTMFITNQENNGALRALAWDVPGYPY